MKRNPRLCSVLLFILALLCFLISEFYFLLNPMFDFILEMYIWPSGLYLFSLAATVGLSRGSHTCAKRLLLALACIISTVMLIGHAYIFVIDRSVAVVYYPYNHSLWLSLTVLFSAGFTTSLACRRTMQSYPGICCVLLFILALFCIILSGLSIFDAPLGWSDFAGWYLGPLLLGVFALCTIAGLYRMRHTCAKRLLLALACITCAVAIGNYAWSNTVDSRLVAEYYPGNLSLWLSVPLLLFSAVAGVLAWKKSHGLLPETGDNDCGKQKE